MTATSNAHVSSVPQTVWKNRFLWTLQILLALVFLAHGAMMLFPPAEVARLMNEALPRWFQLFIGISDPGGCRPYGSRDHRDSVVAGCGLPAVS